MSQDNGQVLEPKFTCMFCGIATPIEPALNDGWVPSFWHNGVEYGGQGKFICPDCVEAHLRFNEEFGDFELLPGHALPGTQEPEKN